MRGKSVCLVEEVDKEDLSSLASSAAIVDAIQGFCSLSMYSRLFIVLYL